MMATLSDRSGQFVATAFDDDATAALEAAAKAGLCGLLTVELDRRAGDETPRVTIKRFQPLERPCQANAAADDRARARWRDSRAHRRASSQTRAAATACFASSCRWRQVARRRRRRPRFRARRRACRPHRAHYRRGERRPLRSGAAEARPRRLSVTPSRTRRGSRGS